MTLSFSLGFHDFLRHVRTYPVTGKKGTDDGGGPNDVKSADSREEGSTAGTRSMTL
jgi:hypothetical protein